MTPTDAEGQAEMLVALPRGRGRNPRGTGCGAVSAWTTKENSERERQDLMQAVVERENMLRVLRRVQSSKGVPGVDGLRVEGLWGYLVQHWPAIKEQLLSGSYEPQPVLGVEIPKSVRSLYRQGRGRRLKTTIAALTPQLRGFAAYYRLAEVKNVFEVDEWLRHKLRTIIWRHWKRRFARAKNLMKRGIAEERAWKSASNGRGPWWNGRAAHRNQAMPVKYIEKLGLVSLLALVRRFQCVA